MAQSLTMRSTSCLYVDTGYLLSAAATRTTGTSLRNGVHVEFEPLIQALVDAAQEISSLPVLRVHWYDSGANGVPDTTQERIGELPRVKLRLGRFGMNGEQKGVDLRIGLDLVTHARNGVSDVFILVSGDDDLTEAVEEAQSHGVQVIVLGVPNAQGRPQSISRHLIRAADDLCLLDGGQIDACVLRVDRNVLPGSSLSEPAVADSATSGTPRSPRRHPAAPKLPVEPADTTGADTETPVPCRSKPGPPSPSTVPPVSPSAMPPKQTGTLAYSSSTGQASHVRPGYGDDDHDEVLRGVVAQILDALVDPSDRRMITQARPSIPRDIDRALLVDASDTLQIDELGEPIRHQVRALFWSEYDTRWP